MSVGFISKIFLLFHMFIRTHLDRKLLMIFVCGKIISKLSLQAFCVPALQIITYLSVIIIKAYEVIQSPEKRLSTIMFIP